MKMRDENQVLLSGYIPAGFLYTHDEYIGEKMYTGDMVIFRENSSVYDILPVIVPERMYRKGTEHMVSVIGEMRSRRVWDGEHKNTLNCIRAIDVKYLDKPEEHDVNEVYLTGEIAFNPKPTKEYKNRKIARIILNIKRSKRNDEKKFDSICCQFWDENAERVAGLKQGQKVKVTGRFQSYEKKGCDSQEQIYVYVNHLEVLNNGEG